ncbi:MAG TPA: hypothetical protein VFL57_06365 [Bryobacteraceae bacterium]|nr:hypothetical protein [Bryobacteraceae bacterium]
MPKTSVDEDDLTPCGKHEIGMPRQVAAVQPKPVSHSVYQRAHDQFGPGVPVADRRHVPAALLGCVNVGHY